MVNVVTPQYCLLCSSPRPMLVYHTSDLGEVATFWQCGTCLRSVDGWQQFEGEESLAAPEPWHDEDPEDETVPETPPPLYEDDSELEDENRALDDPGVDPVLAEVMTEWGGLNRAEQAYLRDRVDNSIPVAANPVHLPLLPQHVVEELAQTRARSGWYPDLPGDTDFEDPLPPRQRRRVEDPAAAGRVVIPMPPSGWREPRTNSG